MALANVLSTLKEEMDKAHDEAHLGALEDCVEVALVDCNVPKDQWPETIEKHFVGDRAIRLKALLCPS